MKLQQDMRKKKQEMLEKQIECQKVLINRLEKNRGMKPEERANIMKTLKELTEKISQLKNEISPSSHATANTTKTKTDVRHDTRVCVSVSSYVDIMWVCKLNEGTFYVGPEGVAGCRVGLS